MSGWLRPDRIVGRTVWGRNERMVLAVESVAKRFRGPSGEILALDGASLSVGAGEFVAVRGPSGCGKTTLLLSAGGLLHPDSGDILLDGENPYRLSPEARSRLRAAKVGFVFQQFHLVPYLTVLDNILAPALAMPHAEARERARWLAQHFGLEQRCNHLPGELSTGERQRTALARALLNKPALLLADEPTGNLDEQNGEIVLRHLAQFANDGGAVLLVTHDARAAQYAHRILPMQNGRISRS